MLRTRGHSHVRRLDPPAADWTAIQELPLQPGDTRDLGWVAYTRNQAVAPLWLTLHWEEPQPEPWYLLSAQTPPRGAIRCACTGNACGLKRCMGT